MFGVRDSFPLEWCEEGATHLMHSTREGKIVFAITSLETSFRNDVMGITAGLPRTINSRGRKFSHLTISDLAPEQHRQPVPAFNEREPTKWQRQ